MRVSSLKYQFCASVDPVRYNTFDIKGARGLEVMVQKHIDSGSPFLELYVEFSRTDECPWRSTYVIVQEARIEEQTESLTTQLCGGFTALLESSQYDIIKSLIGRHSSISALDVNYNGGTPNSQEYGGLDSEDSGEDVRKDFHMHNGDLSIKDALEFAKLPYRRLGHTSSLLDSGDLEVGKEFSSKDGFVVVGKQYNIKNWVNFHIVKSRSDKFEAKCAMEDNTCA
ncbi:hypothetical protein PVK06_035400 [Gossypium arboreum]|uniref:Uncharacterized protein n=1 Tax=Gossypium arboreum TaxID=29729 RepID=A0ABR0NH90_GOSAR|nr:hypothetical protein PVK06_035400 [Gossypium arboreum]